jgi:hypothetical protein
MRYVTVVVTDAISVIGQVGVRGWCWFSQCLGAGLRLAETRQTIRK